MGQHEHTEVSVERAAVEEDLRRVHGHHNELNHLEQGQMLLPPQVLLEPWAERCQQVVRVHDDVDEGVKRAEERSVTTGNEFHPPPNSGWHDSVVDDVQGGDLIVLFAQHEEESVHELGELGEVVPPAQLGDDQLLGIVRIVNHLASETVAASPRVFYSLEEIV